MKNMAYKVKQIQVRPFHGHAYKLHFTPLYINPTAAQRCQYAWVTLVYLFQTGFHHYLKRHQ